MYVKDYEFIESNISALFDREVVIYAAGNFGKRIAVLLEDAGISINCFCDKNKEMCMNYPVITIDELKKLTKQSQCLIVVASKIYNDEIVGDLQREGIDAYVLTWYGLRAGIELNIDDERFHKEFREKIILKKDMYMQFLLAFDYQNVCFEKLYIQSDAVLVYQPGKVGSSTINVTLEREGIESVHIHNIATNLCGVPGADVIRKEQIAYFKKYLMQKGGKRKTKIITLVREPIGRALASYMENFPFDWTPHLFSGNDLLGNAKKFVMQELEDNVEFGWFDKELKDLTGIDIFDYPFDKEKGYTWIKKENVEILVLKTEKMNENEDIVAQFVEKPGLKYVNARIGEGKFSKYIYRELKQKFCVSADVLEKQYSNNPQVDHFYSEEEKAEFRQKWKNKIS